MNSSKPKSPKREYASVKFPILIHIAWRNLTHKRLRAILTIFGVVIGIGSIFFLLSFGIGLQHLVTDQVVGNSSTRSIDVTSQNPNIVQLNNDAVAKIKNLPYVKKSGLSYSFPGKAKIKGSTVDGVVFGVDQIYQEESNLDIKEGNQLSFSDQSQAIIDKSVLDSMGIKDYKEVIGESIELNISLANTKTREPNIKKEYKIIGVVNDSGGSAVYISNQDFEKAGVEHYSQLKVITENSESIPDLRKKIESFGYITTSPIDTLDQINQIFKFFNFILVGFGAIGMIVAVLGMFNTLTISLLERTKEIGLMMALGGRRIDMRKLFLFEAILLSIVGATVGIIMAFILGRAINLVMNITAHRRGVTGSFNLFLAPLWLVAGSILFMVIVGLVVVYIPAKHAEETDPIDALRRE